MCLTCERLQEQYKYMMKFSIITPARNEEKDIRGTLESFLRLTYPNKEVLVVDDSSDKTPEIVKEYAARGVRLIHGPRVGCCEAVNRGIEQATGDIVINADADVRLPENFLEKLKEKYEAGADWVLVDSRVPNTKSVFSRFVGAVHKLEHKGRDDMYYSEAFSCRRDVAMKLGVFGPSYPLRFCRDWLLGKKLVEGGYKKVYDPSIVVLHPQPDNFQEYWNTKKARGRFGPFKQHFMDKFPLSLLCVKLVIKDIVSVIRWMLIIPAVSRVMRVAKFSERKLRDVFPFLYAYCIEEVARCVGEWEAFTAILKLPKEGQNEVQVSLAVHAKYHAFRLAEELAKKNALFRFYTIYPKWKLPPYEIPRKKTTSLFFLGALKRVLGHLRVRDGITGEAFDWMLAKILRRPKKGRWIFQAYSGYCERSLKAAKKKGAVTIVERACPHIDAQEELVQGEKERLLGKREKVSRSQKKVWERMKREYEIADFIIVPSNYSKKSFLERGFPAEKIIVVPLCNEKTISPQREKKDGTFTVLCIGGNFYRKGIVYLLRAWRDIRLQNARLIMKGGIPKEFPDLKDIPNVEVIDRYLSVKELDDLYHEADVLVLPSIDDGFGLVVVEAMMAGVQVIVTENVGAADIIENGKDGFIVPIRDPNALKEKIEYLARHPEVEKAMGAAAAEKAREYAPDKYGERTMRAYKRVLELP